MPLTLFVRVRGRVLGPFDQEKLRSLAARGQFGRMHEVSEDGVSWGRASTYPELFKSEDGHAATAVEADPEPTNDGSAVPPRTSNSEAATSNAGTWYYAVAGNQAGPVSFDQLRTLCSKGEVRSDDRVWTDGMSQWIPAREVNGLLPTVTLHIPTALPHPGHTGSATNTLSNEVVSLLTDTRPWIIMFAVLSALGAVLCIGGGVLFFVLAAKATSVSRMANVFVGYSIMSFLEGGITAVVAYLLFVYAGRIRDFGYHRDQATLALTLRTSKQLVVFWGVITIIGLVLGALIAIYALAIA